MQTGHRDIGLNDNMVTDVKLSSMLHSEEEQSLVWVEMAQWEGNTERLSVNINCLSFKLN